MLNRSGKKMVKKIVLTGGGTAGHVMPNLALAVELEKRGWQIAYIGSRGMERALVEQSKIEFHAIAVGKLRRYFSFQNFTDLFRIALGTLQAWLILRRIKPRAVFSKGGFVSVPVAYAAWLLRVPVLTHESDVSPGLANRLIAKVATKVLYSFPETASYVGADAELVGTPIRLSLFEGNCKRGLETVGFEEQDPRPVVLVMGGSQGAQRINQTIAEGLPVLTKSYRLIHLTGHGNSGASQIPKAYESIPFAGKELPDLLACADIILTRGGANALFEFLALRKPMLVVPLVVGSRGDQVLNAASFERSGYAKVLPEKDLTPDRLLSSLAELCAQENQIKLKQQGFPVVDSIKQIADIIDKI